MGCSSMPPTTGPTGCSQYFREVTTPRLPPPPRNAQKRSAFCSALAVQNVPSAVITSAEIRLSQARPCLRTSQPTPPPRVSPAIPVVDTSCLLYTSDAADEED